jgi:hypothetical protein
MAFDKRDANAIGDNSDLPAVSAGQSGVQATQPLKLA